MISAASSNEYLKNSTNKTATALNRLNFEEINNAGGLTGLSLSNNINNISSVKYLN